MSDEPKCLFVSFQGIGILCGAFEFEIEEWLDVREEYKEIDGFTIIERTTTCIHCGETDIDYPL